MENLKLWFTHNGSKAAVFICVVCILEDYECWSRMTRAKQLRKNGFFEPMKKDFTALFMWTGILVGSLFFGKLGGLWYIFLPLTAALGVLGYRCGKKYGTARDTYWKEKIAPEEQNPEEAGLSSGEDSPASDVIRALRGEDKTEETTKENEE